MHYMTAIVRRSRNNSETESKLGKTGILGGGLTGLTLAYLLKDRGEQIEVLEKENSCGGLMRTLHEKGFSFDYCGSHIIFSKDQKILDFMLSLLGDNKVKKRRNTKVLYKGCYVKYPFENGLADLPKRDNFECLYGFIENLVSKEKGELEKPHNLKEWFKCTFGRGIAEKYLIPYNEKIWKHPLEDMGLDWVERIPDPPVEDIIKAALDIQTEGYTHQLNFYYPKRGGIEALIKALEEKVGNYVTKNFEVKHLKRKNGKWIVSNGKQEKSFDKVVSTIPVHKLVATLNVPSEVKTTVSQLKCNSLVTVMIGLNQSKVNDLSWLYIPDKKTLAHRVSFPSNYSPFVAPSGKSAVMAEITCNIDDRIWRMTDKDIANRVIEDLHALRIIEKNQVCFLRVKKTEYAYVICDLAYRDKLKNIKTYFDEVGISILGRFAEFKYYNMDNCVKRAVDFTKALYDYPENERSDSQKPV